MLNLKEISVTQKPRMRGVADRVFKQMFENTCKALEEIDGSRLSEKTWNCDENNNWVVGKNNRDKIYIDRFLSDGNVFEKVGVNYVAMEGELPPGMTFQKSGALSTTSEVDKINGDGGTPFFATGASFVIHPHNPMAPTAHVNYRYFQIGDGTLPGYSWFGGGADLTPSYLLEEDGVHFHRVHKEVCDKHDPSYYSRFKRSCDDYFYIPHRGECRGIGGIFFDNLKGDNLGDILAFVTDCTKIFVPAYIPIIEKRKDMHFTPEHKHWQHIVRGRYVEFILSCDRGMRFGLASNMVNPQSVFNCMPPGASWEYENQPVVGSDEAILKEVLKNPRVWV